MKAELVKILSHVFHEDSEIYDKIEAVFEKEYRRFIDEKVSERLAETYSMARGDHELEFDEKQDSLKKELEEWLPKKYKAGSLNWAIRTVISRHFN